MADEELHETTADDQKDWQAETDAEAGTSAEETTGDEAAAKSEDNDDDLDIPMDRVEAVLNATADKDSLSPQMQRMMNRQAENTRRVEETIKGTKSNPRWFVPLFCALMIIGLVWAVVYYLTSDYPIPHIGAWNLAIAFAIIMVGFIMTMWWRCAGSRISDAPRPDPAEFNPSKKTPRISSASFSFRFRSVDRMNLPVSSRRRSSPSGTAHAHHPAWWCRTDRRHRRRPA